MPLTRVEEKRRQLIRWGRVDLVVSRVQAFGCLSTSNEM